MHYSTVGAVMGISALTAYTLMRELEKRGFVERELEPAARRGRGGRARIVFRPAALTAAYVTAARERLEAVIAQFGAMADERLAARAYLKAEKARGDDLSFHLGYWLGRLQAGGRDAHLAATSLLEGSAAPAAKIETLSSLSLGSIVARLGRGQLAARVTEARSALAERLDDGQRSLQDQAAAVVEAARSLPSLGSSSRRFGWR